MFSLGDKEELDAWLRVSYMRYYYHYSSNYIIVFALEPQRMNLLLYRGKANSLLLLTGRQGELNAFTELQGIDSDALTRKSVL